MRYIIGLLLGIGLIVLTFILIFRAFSGGGNEQETKQLNLMDYANSGAVVRYTIDGQVNAASLHNRIRVTVSKDQVLFEQIQGYEGKLVQTKTYPSDVQAFSTFLRSLQIAGYTNGNKEFDDDERGYCPLGQRYIYEAIDGGDTLQRWWSTSCSTEIGSFKGQASTIRTLFQRQVPEYTNLTRTIRL